MRKLIAAAFVSLDGVMQAPGGQDEDTSGGFTHGGWTVPFWDDSTVPFMKVFDEPFDLLLGHKTYDIFAAYWPKAPADDPIGPLFTSVTKYVATSSPDSLGWENSVALTGDIAQAVADVKSGDGPPLLTQGSSLLLHALLRNDLIDELRLMTFPVVLGSGKRWFDNGSPGRGFNLIRSETSRTGVVSAIYEPVGEVRTATFPPPWED